MKHFMRGASRLFLMISYLCLWGWALITVDILWWIVYMVGCGAFLVWVLWDAKDSPGENDTPCDCQRKLQDAEQGDIYEEK